jgi:hypothetical protein
VANQDLHLRNQELEKALNALRRDYIEKEAAFSLELNQGDQKIQELQHLLSKKEQALQDAMNDSNIAIFQKSEKCNRDLQLAHNDILKWKGMYSELESNSKNWKEFADSTVKHEQQASFQFQETIFQLREEIKEIRNEYACNIGEKENIIKSLNNQLLASKELIDIERSKFLEQSRLLEQQHDGALAEEKGALQKEIGALQVGLCLQKEMKDELQNHLNHIKSCMRSLAVDLTRSLDMDDKNSIKSYYKQLCDIFDRLLISGAITNTGNGQSATTKISQTWENHIGNMHAYISQHPNLVRSIANNEYSHSFNLDSDFLAVVKSLKDLLKNVVEHQLKTSEHNSIKIEFQKLIEHTQLLKSDLEQSDLLIQSLVEQLMDEGYVDAAGNDDFYLQLLDKYVYALVVLRHGIDLEPSDSIINSFDPETGNLLPGVSLNGIKRLILP